MSDAPLGQQKFINDYLKVKKNVAKAGKTNKPTHVSLKKVAAIDSSSRLTDDKASEDLNDLRQFDLDPMYGPSIDSSRMERWMRASELGLRPPERIKMLILDNGNDPMYTHSVWQQHSLLVSPDI